LRLNLSLSFNNTKGGAAMADTTKRQNGPAFFVNAEIRESKAGKKYVWSRTFDMDEVKRELGTSVVTITIITKKEPRDPKDRLIIINPSEAKYIPRKREGSSGQGAGGSGGAPEGSALDDSESDFVV
jgi:cyclophilin family peptidyl-prolyl cis-trans isomerase